MSDTTTFAIAEHRQLVASAIYSRTLVSLSGIPKLRIFSNDKSLEELNLAECKIGSVDQVTKSHQKLRKVSK